MDKLYLGQVHVGVLSQCFIEDLSNIYHKGTLTTDDESWS